MARLTDAQRDEARRLSAQGLRDGEIAERLQVSRQAVSVALKDAGEPRKTATRTDTERSDRIAALIADGQQLATICERLNCTSQAVHAVAHHRGLAIAPGGAKVPRSRKGVPARRPAVQEPSDEDLSPEDRTELIAMLTAGKSEDECAEWFGCSREVVAGFANALRLAAETDAENAPSGGDAGLSWPASVEEATDTTESANCAPAGAEEPDGKPVSGRWLCWAHDRSVPDAVTIGLLVCVDGESARLFVRRDWRERMEAHRAGTVTVHIEEWLANFAMAVEAVCDGAADAAECARRVCPDNGLSSYFADWGPFAVMHDGQTDAEAILLEDRGSWMLGSEVCRTDGAPDAPQGLAAIVGQWPGDETDEEIDDALQGLRGEPTPVDAQEPDINATIRVDSDEACERVMRLLAAAKAVGKSEASWGPSLDAKLRSLAKVCRIGRVSPALAALCGARMAHGHREHGNDCADLDLDREIGCEILDGVNYMALHDALGGKLHRCERTALRLLARAARLLGVA